MHDMGKLQWLKKKLVLREKIVQHGNVLYAPRSEDAVGTVLRDENLTLSVVLVEREGLMCPNQDEWWLIRPELVEEVLTTLFPELSQAA